MDSIIGTGIIRSSEYWGGLSNSCLVGSEGKGEEVAGSESGTGGFTERSHLCWLLINGTFSAAKAKKRGLRGGNNMCKCTERIYCIYETAIILFVKYGYRKQVTED